MSFRPRWFFNINIVYLTVQSTAILQPLDQGVIYTFKAYYRKLLSEKLLTLLGHESTADSVSKHIAFVSGIF